jgi:hypothetical protein
MEPGNRKSTKIYKFGTSCSKESRHPDHRTIQLLHVVFSICHTLEDSDIVRWKQKHLNNLTGAKRREWIGMGEWDDY